MNKTILFRMAALLAAVLAVAVALGAGPSLLERTAFLMTSPHVALDLKLTASQVSQRADVMAAYDRSRNDVVERMKAASAGQYDSFRAELDKLENDTASKLVAILTPAQVTRLKQIGIQNEGTDAMQDDSIAADLGLTAVQRTKIKAVYDSVQKAEDDYQAALGEALAKIPDPGSDEAALKAYSAKQQGVIASMKPREKQYLSAKANGDKQILSILTPAQRNKWVAMRGKPLKSGA